MQVFVSLSLPRTQFLREDLATEVRQLLTRTALPKNSLRLEIGESVVMENPEQAGTVLENLQGTGADLILDDFGAGYSSLPYLHKFPLATLKIDRSMIQGTLASDSAGAAVVRSLVSLTHGLGKTACADGVETADGASFLRGLGCEFGQGFYFGGLILDRDVPQLLKAIRKSESKLQPRSFFRSKNKHKKTDAPAETTPPTQQPAAIAAKSAAPLPKGGAVKVIAKRPPHDTRSPRPEAPSTLPPPPGLHREAASNGFHANGSNGQQQLNAEPAVMDLIRMGPNPLTATHVTAPPKAVPPPFMPPPMPNGTRVNGSPPNGLPDEVLALAPLQPAPPPLPPSGHPDIAQALAASLSEPIPVSAAFTELSTPPTPVVFNPLPVQMPPPAPLHTHEISANGLGSAGNGIGNAAHVLHPALAAVRPPRAPIGPAPDLSQLPPAIANSLARLAGAERARKPAK
jgi:EAL domain-containing protein (putative c-di-GMP-specific phosphodiesterase class I)